MRLVVDANVLFSALLKAGMTRKLVFDRRLVLFSPRFLLKEFEKYASELEKRSGLKKDDFLELAELMLSRINLIPDDEITPFIPAAKHLSKDENDIAYAACALAVDAELWTSDRHLIQPRIRVWNTAQLVEQLGA